MIGGKRYIYNTSSILIGIIAILSIGTFTHILTITQLAFALKIPNNESADLIANVVAKSSSNITSMQQDVRVSITQNAPVNEDKAFSPNPVNITLGDTVVWTNDDAAIHTVTSGFDPSDPLAGKNFDSKLLNPDETFKHTFNTTGDFVYHCEIHPTMVGKISVR
jgi:plastocyanin